MEEKSTGAAVSSQSIEQGVEASTSQSTTRHQGRIKQFDTAQGFGFIECEECKLLYGYDVFLNRSVEGGCCVGAPVSFEIELSPAKKPQARNVRLEMSSPEQSALAGQEQMGRVKSVNASRGFGFLICPAVNKERGSN
eukprot:5886803-Amphidinium_carterae.1